MIDENIIREKYKRQSGENDVQFAARVARLENAERVRKEADETASRGHNRQVEEDLERQRRPRGFTFSR